MPRHYSQHQEAEMLYSSYFSDILRKDVQTILNVKVQPYFQNFLKRLIKSPKIYFTGTGLVCYLLEIHCFEQLSRHPLIGNLFENMAMLEILKTQYNQGQDKDIYYFRDSKGFEIDAIVPTSPDSFIPFEFKSAMTFSSYFTVILKKMGKFAP